MASEFACGMPTNDIYIVDDHQFGRRKPAYLFLTGFVLSTNGSIMGTIRKLFKKQTR